MKSKSKSNIRQDKLPLVIQPPAGSVAPVASIPHPRDAGRVALSLCPIQPSYTVHVGSLSVDPCAPLVIPLPPVLTANWHGCKSSDFFCFSCVSVEDPCRCYTERMRLVPVSMSFPYSSVLNTEYEYEYFYFIPCSAVSWPAASSVQSADYGECPTAGIGDQAFFSSRWR